MPSTKTLNEEQLQAVNHGKGPLLIIAGAGTGKTTVITQRIKHLIIDEKVPPSEILALTFTDKAAREMEERVDISLPYGYTQLWIATFHAFCDRILRDEAIHIGLNPGFRLVTEAEAILFLRKNLFKLKLHYFRPLGNPYKFIQGFLGHVSRLKDDDITPEQYIKYVEDGTHDTEEREKISELAYAYQIYEELKTKEGIMDFGDLNANVLKLFRQRKNVLSQYQNKFKYILVDEFQDTNFSQNELAMLMAGEQQNITVVGDDDQAIYRWRGAAIANIIQFRQHYPKAKIITLTKNYRSTQEILDRAYQLIQNNNPDRLEIKENINKKLFAERGEKGEPVEFLFAPRVENESEVVVQKIQELAKKKKFKYKHFAILVRANDHAQPFTRALERARIPYQFLGPGHLFHQEEIKDLIAYLKVLYNFEDNAALYRVITMPLFNLAARDIAAILNYAKRKNLLLFETLEQIDDTLLLPETKEKVKNLIDMIKRHLERVPRDPAGQILYYFFEDSGLLRQYLDTSNVNEERKAQNIAKFFEKLKKFEAQNMDASIFAVVDWIDLSMELGEIPLASDIDWSENNAVNIMTVHSSKGLEFPVVFIVSLVTQRFPTRERKEQIPIPDDLIKEILPEGDYNLQEERRLFYVAMTRARDQLYLTAANYYGEGKRERKISPFVYETFTEQYINTVLKKRKEESFVHQLSLLDSLKEEQTAAAKTFEIEPIQNSPAEISYMSYSQIQTFAICPLHYKLKYILKIPPQPVAALSFGISLHNVMKEYYQYLLRGEKVGEETRYHIIKKNWIKDGYQSKEHEKEAFAHAKTILEKYVSEHKKEISLPIALELPFQFYLKELKIIGRFDRIDKLSNGKLEIIDYKTGDTIPEEKKLAKDMQLSMYALAATKVHDTLLGKKPEQIDLSLYYLDKGIKLTTQRTAEQLAEVEEAILKKTEEIAASDFSCSKSIFCKACEYKMVCQTYGS